MNLNRAMIAWCDGAERMILDSVSAFPRDAGDVYALVYLVESSQADGSPVPGFRPGYVATVWPTSSISDNWLVGAFSDGTEFCFLPRERWGEGRDFRLDIVESVTPTFSLTRQ